MSRLDGWTPFRLARQQGELMVDWCHLAEKRFTEPFFYETISMVIGHPFNQAFRPRTRADDLAALPPGLTPSGFIFHMSRCGSTLCAQALAADPANIVVSEALPIRHVLQAPCADEVASARVDGWLAGLVGALARPRFAGERRFFVKFMAADVLEIERVLRVFPDVPWIFVYREPLEILASLRARGGADSMRGQIVPERLGLSREAMMALSSEAYQCHVLAAMGRAALGAGGRGLMLNYRDLPAALWTRLPGHFGFALDPAARTRVEAVAARDAKFPSHAFSPDGHAKQAVAPAWTSLAETIIGPVFAALEARDDFCRTDELDGLLPSGRSTSQ